MSLIAPTKVLDIDAAQNEDKEHLMESLESAIHYLYSLGWAHNDLDPTNVLVTKEGRPILMTVTRLVESGRPCPTAVATKV